MIVEFQAEGKGWPSVEGFLLREYLAGNLNLDNCIQVREVYIEMNPYQRFPPQWKLLKRWLGKSYASKPILKKRSQPEVAIEEDDYFLKRMLEG